MEREEQKNKIIFTVVLFSSIITSLLSTALSTALPKIMEYYELTAATGQWVTSIYSLVMGIAVLTSAYLVKKFQTKKLYLCSIAVFAFGLLLDGLPLPFSIFMVGRVLQAISNGILLALTQVIILTIFPIEKRGTYMGIYGLAVGGAPILAPTLAGIIIDLAGWRMIFYSTLVAMVIILIISTFIFENVLENENVILDFSSLILCSLGYIGLLLGVGNVSSYGLVSLYTLLPMILGLVSAIIFVKRQLNTAKPFLDVKILKVKDYRIAVISSMLLYIGMMTATVVLPIYLQHIRGFSATNSGLIMIPGSLSLAIISPMVGKFYDKYGIKTLFIIGSVLQTIAYIGMGFFTVESSLPYVVCCQTLANISIAFLMMPLATWGMSQLSAEKTSDGTSLLTSLRTVAGSFGIAIFVGLMTYIGNLSTDIHGVKVTYICLAILGIIMLLTAIFAVKNKQN